MANPKLPQNMKHHTPNVVQGNATPPLGELNLLLHNPILADTKTTRQTWVREIDLPEFGSMNFTANIQQVNNGKALSLPHGLDADILFGLLQAVHLGQVAKGEYLAISARKLLKLSYLSDNARNYQVLKDCLQRLYHTSYTFTNWIIGRGKSGEFTQRTSEFRLIGMVSELNRVTDQTLIDNYNAQNDELASIHMRANTILQIYVQPYIIDSLHKKLVRPLDERVLRSLKRPLHRTAYRVLINFDHHEIITQPLRFWSHYLGFDKNTRSDSQRRSITSALDALIEAKFLREYEITHQNGIEYLTIKYVPANERQSPTIPGYIPFSPFGIRANSSFALTDDEILDLNHDENQPPETTEKSTYIQLLSFGVNGKSATELAEKHDELTIKAAMTLITEMDARAQIRNKAGLLIQMLNQPANYPEFQNRLKTIQRPKVQIEPPAPAPIPELMPVRSVELLFKKKVSKDDLTLLTQLAQSGEYKSAELMTLANKTAEEIAQVLTTHKMAALPKETASLPQLL